MMERNEGQKDVLTVIDYYVQMRSASPKDAKEYTMRLIERMAGWTAWEGNKDILINLIEGLETL